jgi:hypothetical protein
LKDHCWRATSEQVSSTIGLLPAVEPSLLLRHSPLATLLTRYFPDAAEAVKFHSCCGLVPSPQPYCCSWVPETVDELGTSMHRVLLTLDRLNGPPPCTRHCC